MIFPLLVLGRSGVNAIHFGLAIGADQLADVISQLDDQVRRFVVAGSQRHERRDGLTCLGVALATTAASATAG